MIFICFHLEQVLGSRLEIFIQTSVITTGFTQRGLRTFLYVAELSVQRIELALELGVFGLQGITFQGHLPQHALRLGRLLVIGIAGRYNSHRQGKQYCRRHFIN